MTLHYNTTLRPNRDEKAKNDCGPDAQVFAKKQTATCLVGIEVRLLFNIAQHSQCAGKGRGSENIPKELARDNSS